MERYLKTFNEFINESEENVMDNTQDKEMSGMILQALKDAYLDVKNRLKNNTKTKKKVVTVYIDDITPINICDFIKKKNIPEDSWFGTENDYRVTINYNKIIKWTKDDENEFLSKQFENTSFREVYKRLTENGYKRVDGRTDIRTPKYELYKNKDYNTLIKYYSLFFVKS